MPASFLCESKKFTFLIPYLVCVVFRKHFSEIHFRKSKNKTANLHSVNLISISFLIFLLSFPCNPQAADLTKPVDKRIYKGTYPTCHDFNTTTVTSEGVFLLVGFSAGQIQLIDPIKKELSKLYNEEVRIHVESGDVVLFVPT